MRCARAQRQNGVQLRIGFLSLPLTGHLNPMLALAGALQKRGHKIVFFNLPDMEQISLAADIPFVPFGKDDAPIGFVPKLLGPLAGLSGLAVVEDWFQRIVPALLDVVFKHLPEVLASNPVDGLIIDAAYNTAPLVAIHGRVPFLQLWLPMHYDLSGSTPIPTFDWLPEKTPEALARNRQALQQMAQQATPAFAKGAAYAEAVGLSIDLHDPGALASPLAILTQTPREFDFPDISIPPQFRYLGPLQDDAARASVPFSWEKLDSRPLVYASLGTLVNGSEAIRDVLLQAMRALPELQCVLALGGSELPPNHQKYPENIIVVQQAPQLDLLKRASLCMTHAGLNTVLECLRFGVPMVAIPIGFDQPGVAARIEYHQVGETISLETLTADRLAAAIRHVLHEPAYRASTARFKTTIAANYGLDRAVKLVEHAFASQPSENQIDGHELR